MRNAEFMGSLVLGLFIFLGLAVMGYYLGASAIAFKEYERTVTVKGLSEKELPADIVLWPVPFSAAGNDLASLYAALERDADTIVTFLKTNGFADAEISVSTARIVDRLAQGYEKSKLEFRYYATRTVTVYSRNIETVRRTMRNLAQLGQQGIALTEGGYDDATEYLFTGLNEVKPQMVEEATMKAREVAEKFAKDSNSRLGKIKRARQGQFSIQSRDKNNPHIKKVRVVSTIEYYLSD